MKDYTLVNLTPDNIADYGVCGYKDVKKHKELRNKIAWYKQYYPKGLRIKVIISELGGYQGMLEYMPGEIAHRPVEVDGYMFIQCIFVGFKKQYRGKSFASALLDECKSEARSQNKLGVTVVTRKGSFMVNSDIFLKRGYQIVDSVKPDFSLLVKKFDQSIENPRFKSGMSDKLNKYGKGLTILRSAQCPYTEKNVNAIMETAKKLKIDTTLIDLKDHNDAQNNPSPFGTFCIIYNGKIITHHPISNTRFNNILGKFLK